MSDMKKLIPLIVGLSVGASIWVFLGGVLRDVSESLLVTGGVNGLATLIGGVGANVVAEKLLGIGDETNV